jgi:hypothetical protein
LGKGSKKRRKTKQTKKFGDDSKKYRRLTKRRKT